MYPFQQIAYARDDSVLIQTDYIQKKVNDIRVHWLRSPYPYDKLVS